MVNISELIYPVATFSIGVLFGWIASFFVFKEMVKQRKEFDTKIEEMEKNIRAYIDGGKK